jgi:hypothetical protein
MKLVVEHGPLRGREFPIEKETVVGRLPTCTVAVSDTKVSREHARFFLAAGAMYVADLGSSNGTFVNGRRVTSPVRLSTGDRVVVGETTFRVQEAPRAPEPAAPGLASSAARGTGIAASPGVAETVRPENIRVKRRLLQFSPERNRPSNGVLIQDLGQRSLVFRLFVALLGVALVAALTYGVAVLVAGTPGKPPASRPAPADPEFP